MTLRTHLPVRTEVWAGLPVNYQCMRNTKGLGSRTGSFLSSALMDGALGLVQTAIPLLAIRLGASAWFLGMLGWIPQSVRLPFTITSGALSDRIGRMRVILPAAVVTLLACIGLAFAGSRTQVLVTYVFIMASVGAFYPALQAFIGDRSPQGELRNNLTAFNLGWTIGGAACSLAAGYLFAAHRGLPFAAAGLLVVALICVIVLWSRTPSSSASTAAHDPARAGSDPGSLLVIARIGHFLGFFGYAMVRNLFPKLGTELRMSPGRIGLVVGMILVGEAIGMLATGASPWWRGKLWPQILAQVMMVCAGLIIFFARSDAAFGVAFLLQGISLGVAYTGALYYGLQARTNMGRSTGIHESLVAGASILGSLAGGATAQFISLRAPYITFALIASIGILASVLCRRRLPKPQA